MTATADWAKYEFSIFEYSNTYKELDTQLNVERTYRKVIRLRLHDYPGEDYGRQAAIKKLPQLQNAVLILFFDIDANNDKGIIEINKNNSYYSFSFMESVEAQKGITRNVSKVIVAFNKCDLIPIYTEKKAAEKKLKEINKDALDRITSLFGGQVEFFFISAKDNKKLITLLGTVGSTCLPMEEREMFYKKLRKLSDGVE
jgi:translation elongation factor EF-1alpha